MARLDGKIERAGYSNGCDWATISLEENDRTLEHGPGGAHPGTKHGAVGGCLMVRVVPGVFDGFRLRESADGQDTEDEDHRKNSEGCVMHRHSIKKDDRPA